MVIVATLARRGGIPPAVEGQMSSTKVKGRRWRICHELVAPLTDRSRTSTVQIRAFKKRGQMGLGCHVAPPLG